VTQDEVVAAAAERPISVRQSGVEPCLRQADAAVHKGRPEERDQRPG
jgi:hypothetical protein